MKSLELTGNDLDYWVARAIGMVSCDKWRIYSIGSYIKDDSDCEHDKCYPTSYIPEFSTNWGWGGPIMQEHIELVKKNLVIEDGNFVCTDGWLAYSGSAHSFGDSILEAAMRCVVFEKFGKEVPDEKY